MRTWLFSKNLSALWAGRRNLYLPDQTTRELCLETVCQSKMARLSGKVSFVWFLILHTLFFFKLYSEPYLIGTMISWSLDLDLIWSPDHISWPYLDHILSDRQSYLTGDLMFLYISSTCARHILWILLICFRHVLHMAYAVRGRVKLRVWMGMSGPKSCEALASTYRLHHSLDGCLEFQSSRWSRRVQS